MTSQRKAGAAFWVLVAVVILSFPESVFGITTDYEDVWMDEIVFSPRRFPQKTQKTPENILVVASDYMKTLPANDPAEALQNVMGVDMSPRTRFGHYTPLSIHGSSSNHVLVMVDGIPFNTQASGQADILPALPLENLDRIEVIKGSASSAWGSALGGVVHLITKDVGTTAEPHGKVTAAFSEFGGQRESFEAKGKLDRVGYYVSGEYRDAAGARSGSVQTREDVQQKKLFGKISSPISEILKLTGSWGYTSADTNEGAYLTGLTRTEAPYYARYGQLRLEADPYERNHAEAAVKFNKQSIFSTTLSGNTPSSSVRTRDGYLGFELKDAMYFREEDLFVLGYDASRSVLKSSQMDESRDVWIQAPYTSYTAVLTPVDVVGSLRWDWNDEFGDQWSPGLAGIYHFPEKWHALCRTSVTRSFNAPPLLWKYFEDVSPGVTANNPGIRPERAWVYETGFETVGLSHVWSKLSLYQSEITDAIATDVNESGLFIKKNFKKFRARGIEWESKLKITRETFVTFSAEYNDVEDRTTGLGARNRGALKPGFLVALDGRYPCGFGFHVGGRYSRFDSSASLRPNDRKFVFDAKVYQTFAKAMAGNDMTVFLNVYNLSDADYWSDWNFPLPERYFEGGVTFEF